MKWYPKMFGLYSDDDAPWGQHCIAFDKLDGSNLRFEWNKKQGWYKFGTRNRMFDRSDKVDVLEIRLHELNPVVDLFVLAEATRTHSNQIKPLYFEENKARFGSFLPKIKHLVVDDLPNGNDPWEREVFQRKMLIDRAFADLPDLAIAMISDADEIPSASIVARLPQILQEMGQAFSVQQFFCCYHANRILCVDGNSDKVVYWSGTRVAQVGAWRGRAGREGTAKQVFGGWHLSYMGGVEGIRHKLEAYAHHQDDDHKVFTPEKIAERMAAGRTLRETENFTTIELAPELWPQYLRENQQKFAHLIA